MTKLPPAAKPALKTAAKPMAKRVPALKLAVGKTVGYTSRTHTGRGKIEKIYEKATGTWVTIKDKERNATVTVRPSQVSA